MTEEQKAAYVNAMAACVMAEALGMMTENLERVQEGEAPAYNQQAFRGPIDQYGVHSNGVLRLFHD